VSASSFLKDSKYLVAESEHGQEAMVTLKDRLFDLFYEYSNSGYGWLYRDSFYSAVGKGERERIPELWRLFPT